MAFWLNAYNALVLQTVIDHYPIARGSKTYPPHSIRQIPGAFERLTHRVGGRTVTLDQIEQTILPAFHDPRVYLALGRGVGRRRAPAQRSLRAGPARGAAHRGRQRVRQPAAVLAGRRRDEHRFGQLDLLVARQGLHRRLRRRRRAAFASRSPIERAVLAFVEPKLLTTEREFLGKNQFKVAFKPFDWTLNDLTGRGGR